MGNLKLLEDRFVKLKNLVDPVDKKQKEKVVKNNYINNQSLFCIINYGFFFQYKFCERI